MKKRCKVCGDELQKDGRTEHYGCRNTKKLLKQGTEKAANRVFDSAVKNLEKRPKLWSRLLDLV
jgi:hypothetical protein